MSHVRGGADGWVREGGNDLLKARDSNLGDRGTWRDRSCIPLKLA